jgi:starch phosphorylase
MKARERITSECNAPTGTPESLHEGITRRLICSMGKDPLTASPRDWFHATALAVRDHLIRQWIETMRSYSSTDAKRVYYLSMEFLTGRLLSNSLLNLDLYDDCREVLSEMDLDFDDLSELEPDAALGNGGLGRLAACLLDSMATLSIPGCGYGIRYEYGMFFQVIANGFQLEYSDNWLRYGNPWELLRPDVFYPVRFGGRVVQFTDSQGRQCYDWVGAEEVMAMASDTPVPGFGTDTVNHMRLWSAKSSRELNLRDFNEGNYIGAVQQKTQSENLSKVLYPDDTTTNGRELRFKQQYFFVSASLQDILRRFLSSHSSLDELPDKVAIQLNDTHPSIAIPELMRVLVDLHQLDWDRAWDLTRRTFAYTNHTLMPEALETWPVELFERLLPRHLQIVYEINHRFLEAVSRQHPGDLALRRRLSIVDEAGGRRLRMAHLAVVGSHRVNGVSQIHTDLMRSTIFADFDRIAPGTIVNITNGITPRRWLQHANRELAELVSESIGTAWQRDLMRLHELAPLAERADFRARFREVKRASKRRLAELIRERVGVDVDTGSMFDVQVKRIHEYKRQLLNVLHVVTRYNRIREGRLHVAVPRTVIFSGKAAPSYAMAKLVIKLIHDVAEVVNHDPIVGDVLKVVFVPNYSVSNAERIIPACDLSEQISTSGTEASGTGNMKLALGGALTIGTLDGANIEMCREVGEDNIFTFGLRAEEVAALREEGYDPWRLYHADPELRQALDMIAGGYFSPTSPELFRPLFDGLTRGGDPFLVLADYAAYVACQERVDALFLDPEEWSRRAVLNVAGMGAFSSDRTVHEYAEIIWHAKPVRREG